jgi:6-pyruvoyltetrahydropterin/6-carboxytetrahydropterin synthase
LSLIIRTYITDKLDHKNLNLDVPFMQGLMPSTENVAIAIWKELLPYINALDCRLHSIKLYETENNYVEYFGEE